MTHKRPVVLAACAGLIGMMTIAPAFSAYAGWKEDGSSWAVSYTHLDVYKRQC